MPNIQNFYCECCAAEFQIEYDEFYDSDLRDRRCDYCYEALHNACTWLRDPLTGAYRSTCRMRYSGMSVSRAYPGYGAAPMPDYGPSRRDVPRWRREVIDGTQFETVKE